MMSFPRKRESIGVIPACLRQESSFYVVADLSAV